MRTLLSLMAALLLSLPALANGKADDPQPHTDADVKAATERFVQDYGEKDMDKRLRILKWYGLYMHKTVLKRLKKIWLKEKNVELKGVAAVGLGNQAPFTRSASLALMQGIEKFKGFASRDMPEDDDALEQELEARALVNALTALGKLGRKPDKKGWKTIKSLIDHPHDDVTIGMLNWCGATKEWRALPVILGWFEFYPDGYSWSGGSVKVDTGAAGNKDANAAKAKFNAKFGGRAKKARPAAHAAMRQALEDITGKKFTKSEDLKAWMKENKLLLRKNGV